jgi:hypothetical protein
MGARSAELQHSGAIALVIAATSNLLTKIVAVRVLAGSALAARVAAVFAIVFVAGLTCLAAIALW